MPKRKIRRAFHSLSLKITFILLLVLIVLFTLNSISCWRFQIGMLEDDLKKCGLRTSAVVKQGLYRLMLLNDREDIRETIIKLAEEPLIERVRIFNIKGEIKFSNHENEVGAVLDSSTSTCHSCHGNAAALKSSITCSSTRIYRKSNDQRVLELLNPIFNQPECSNAACHAHAPEEKILGVLDFHISLHELDETAFNVRTKSYSISIIFILVSLILISMVLYFTLHVPIQKLRMGTEALAKGSLSYRIDMQRNDELGLLARSFNLMTDNLQQAHEEHQAWSSELELHVKKKTEELEKIHHNMIQVEKMASLGTLAATVAHEINNPLAGIVTYAKLLQKKIRRLLPKESNTELVEELELIRSESMRCGNIVRDLLIFARGSSVKLHKCDLNDIVYQALGIVKHHLELAEISHKFTNELTSSDIICDFGQLQQALIALFVNAVEAMPNGGHLDICIKPSPDAEKMIRIIIHDTGGGIPEEIRDKIFEPFYSTKNDSKGVGLGLAVVYGIIQRHHGKLWFDSTRGNGTIFNIELPVNITELN